MGCKFYSVADTPMKASIPPCMHDAASQPVSWLAASCITLSHTNDFAEISMGSSAQDRHKSLRKTKTSHVQSMEHRHCRWRWMAHNHQCCQFWAPFPSFEWKKPGISNFANRQI